MISKQDFDFILSSVDFSRLAGKRILITGGSGFIGHWLSVVPANVIVKPLNHLQYDYSGWEFHEWDWIIHLANVSPEKVIACASRCGASIFFASSGAVYDKEPGEYSLEKLHSERLMLDSRCDARIARMYTFAGAYMRNHFAIINYIMDALKGDPIRIRGDNVTRSYLYAADMAVWIWKIILDGYNGCIYEMGGEQAVDMRHLAQAVAANFTPEPNIIEDRIYGPDARPYYVPDLQQIQADLKVRQTVGLEEAIKRTIVHYSDEMSKAVI